MNLRQLIAEASKPGPVLVFVNVSDKEGTYLPINKAELMKYLCSDDITFTDGEFYGHRTDAGDFYLEPNTDPHGL